MRAMQKALMARGFDCDGAAELAQTISDDAKADEDWLGK